MLVLWRTVTEIRARFSETSGEPPHYTTRWGLLKQPDKQKLMRQVSDWCSGAAAYFGWMREAKRENTRCGL
jgi:hypothetical protein